MAEAIRISSDFIGSVLLFEAAPESARPSASALRNSLLGTLETIAKQVPDEAELAEIRFALIAFADERIMSSDWSGVEDWKRDTLSLLLLGTSRAGNEFFQKLAALRPEQLLAREIYFLCLCFGFEGEHAGDPAGLGELKRQSYENLRAARRAKDLASIERIAPPACEVVIELPNRPSRRVLPRLIGIGLGAGAVWCVLWLLLGFLADRVPVPGVTG